MGGVFVFTEHSWFSFDGDTSAARGHFGVTLQGVGIHEGTDLARRSRDGDVVSGEAGGMDVALQGVGVHIGADVIFTSRDGDVAACVEATTDVTAGF